MKSLVIAYKYPLPEIGGDRIRTMNFVRYFEKYGEVDILYYYPADQGAVIGPPFSKNFYFDIYEGDGHKNKFSYFYEKIKYTKPWAVPDFTKQAIKKIAEIIKQEDYDYILCRYSLNAFPLFFLSEKYRKRTVVDIDDLITWKFYGSGCENLSVCKNIKALIDFKLYQHYQIKCARLGKALVCSEKDKGIISKKIDSKNVFIVPNIVPELDLSNGYNKNGYCNIGTILFVGNLAYGPNVKGIKWFIKEIFDKLVREGHQIKLVIAGKDPEPQLRNICNSYDMIDLVYSPQNIVPLYNGCGAVIVPLLAGAGTRIKILEAGYALRPIMTTRIGAYGLNLIDYEHVLYFDDHHSFVERHNWLTENVNYEQITNNMRNYVTENYSINNFKNAMDRVLFS